MPRMASLTAALLSWSETFCKYEASYEQGVCTFAVLYSWKSQICKNILFEVSVYE